MFYDDLAPACLKNVDIHLRNLHPQARVSCVYGSHCGRRVAHAEARYSQMSGDASLSFRTGLSRQRDYQSNEISRHPLADPLGSS